MAWTNDEKQLLIDNYELMTDKELIALLNKTPGQLRGMKERLGLNSKLNIFSEKEKETIINYYCSHDDEDFNLDELASMINRPKTSICRFANKEQLTNINRNKSIYQKDKIKDGVNKYISTDKYKDNIYKKQTELLRYYAKNEHPKGMLGKHHDEETRKNMSVSHLELAANMSYEEKHKIAMKAVKTKIKNKTTTSTTSNSYSRTKSGIRKDLGQYFRSSWEANIARILDYENIEWQYECNRFYFKEDIDGVISYQPDFYLPQFHKWIEVKGWMDDKSKTRLSLFEKQYPEEYKNLILIDRKFYESLQKEFKDIITYWEDGSKKVSELNKII